MIVKKLIDAITGLGGILQAAGSNQAAEDVRSLRKVLPEDAQTDARHALADLRELLERAQTDLVDAYSKRLQDAGTDESAFDTVCGDLNKDKAIGKDEANAIAHQYTGGRKKWPSRKAALDAIRKKFTERAYQEGKMKIVQRYKVG